MGEGKKFRAIRARAATYILGTFLSRETVPFHYLDSETGLYRKEDFSRMKEPSVVVVSEKGENFDYLSRKGNFLSRLFLVDCSERELDWPSKKARPSREYRISETKFY